MSDQRVKVRIESEADARAVDQFDRKLTELEGHVRGLEKAGKSLGSSFSTGLGLGLGNTVFNKLQQLPQFFQQAVTEGIQFNATVESARLGIAAVLKQFDDAGKFATFNDAMREAGGAIDALKEKAKESPATFEQLVTGFQGLSGSFASAGFSMKQSVDMVVLMSQALSGLGIRSDQLLQESRALVSGNINEDAAAARILGITKAQVDSARESGKLFDFLTDKLGAFAEAGELGAQTVNVQLSNIEDNLTQLKGIATEEFFTQIRGGLADINKELGSGKAERWAAGIGGALSAAVTAAEAAMKSPAFKLLTWNPLRDAAAGPIASAFSASANARTASSLDTEKLSLRKGLNVSGEAEQTAAVKAIEDAIAVRRREAADAEGEHLQLLERHVAVLQSMLDRRDKILANVKAEAPAQEKVLALTEAQMKALGKDLDDTMRKEGERFTKKQDFLTSLRDELAIQRAVTDGNDTLAKTLEIERDLRKEIAAIGKSELLPAEREEATLLANKTAELQKQKVLNDQMAKAAPEPESGVNPMFQSRIEDRPKGRGYRDENGRFHIRRQGYIDGRAEPSPQNREGGLTSGGDWQSIFGGGGSSPSAVATATGEMFGPADPSNPPSPYNDPTNPLAQEMAAGLADPSNPPSPYLDPTNPLAMEMAAGLAGPNATPPLGEMMGPSLGEMTAGVLEANGIGEPGAGGSGNAAEAVAAAGEAGQEAGGSLTDAAGKLQEAMEGITETASGDFGAVSSAVTALGAELTSGLQTIKQDLEALKGQVAGLMN